MASCFLLGAVHVTFDYAKLPAKVPIEACAAAQTGCLHKKHHKEWRSGKLLLFGLRSKGHHLHCQPGQGLHLATTGALASDLFKRNVSSKNSVNSPQHGKRNK